MKPKLWLIIPCYNEQAILRHTADLLSQKMNEMIDSQVISSESRIVLVDDGSTDQTRTIIREKCKESSMFYGIILSRNFGQQRALLAGMMYACGKCDCIISMDADLQDDINVLPNFIEKFRAGYHVVYGVRSDRSSDSWFKKYTALLFYKLMNCMGAKIVENHSECRLLSDKALHALQEYKESNLFIRHIIPCLGFDNAVVYYARQKRIAGETKYSAWKLVCLALDGIISSSEKPLQTVPLMGAFCIGLGIMGAPCNNWILGGLQLLCFGIMCQYIEKISVEVKHRPRYIIEEIIGGDAT